MIRTSATLGHLSDGYHPHMWWGDGWWMLFWGLLMMSAMVVFAVWAVRALRTVQSDRPGSLDRGPTDPLHSVRRILAERFAQGELTAEEYSERLRHLEDPSGR